MSTALLLRIASVISLVFTAGHTLGGRRNWSQWADNAVLKAMTDVRSTPWARTGRTRLLHGVRMGPSASSC